MLLALHLRLYAGISYSARSWFHAHNLPFPIPFTYCSSHLMPSDYLLAAAIVVVLPENDGVRVRQEARSIREQRQLPTDLPYARSGFTRKTSKGSIRVRFLVFS
jgi:hypothetical protein